MTSSCEACISDSECGLGARCVPTQFKGQPHGSFCLPVATGTCPNRYATTRAATSLLGVSGNYCSPRSELTACEAVRSFGNPCPPSECGGATGLCLDGRCTYPCGGNADCIGNNNCIGAVPPQYCNPN